MDVLATAEKQLDGNTEGTAKQAAQDATTAKQTAAQAQADVNVIKGRTNITDEAFEIIDPEGNVMASYGARTVIGPEGDMQMTIDNTGMYFGKPGMWSFWLNPEAIVTEQIGSEDAYSGSEIIATSPSTDFNIDGPALMIYSVKDAAGHDWTDVAKAHQRYPIIAVPIAKSAMTFPVTIIYASGASFMDSYAAELNGGFAAYEHFATRKSLWLGDLIVPAVLTSNGGRLVFSIPTGRVFNENFTITRLSCGIVVRASNAAGTGTYIIKSSSGGSSQADFEYIADKKYTTSDPLMTFYDGANTKRTPTKKPEITLEGGTNILFDWATETTDYFTGNSTVRGNTNNNACTVWLQGIEIEFIDEGMQSLSDDGDELL